MNEHPGTEAAPPSVESVRVPHTVGDIMAVMDRAYPPRSAEKWDHPGLVCGDPHAVVNKVCCAVDLTPETLNEALAQGAQMVITHHPVLFQAVHSVAASMPKGKLIHTAISAGCALFCAHTNADSANPGVNDALAEALGLTVLRPLIPHHPDALDRWVVHVPGSQVPVVQDAIFAVGGGALGDYTQCSFRVDGIGQFLPEKGADPYLGRPGELETVSESRIEFVAERRLRAQIQEALTTSHPYEEPSYDILESYAPAHGSNLADAPGLGRIGTLAQPLPLREFVEVVAEALPSTVWGVRAAGDPTAIIETVAVCGGAGGSFLDDARVAGVDCYVTSDLRHHPVDDFLQAGGSAVIDTAHAASEYPWLSQVADLLVRELDLDVAVLPLVTDPWTLHSQ